MSRQEPPDNRAPFHMEHVRQRLDQLELKLQMVVTAVRELQLEVRSLSEATRSAPIASELEPYTLSGVKLPKP